MILTEEEAKTKWCPQRRDPWFDYSNGEKVYVSCNDPSECKCFASGCMMWRWEVTNPNYEGPEKYHDKGYCGLAGRTP